MNQEYIPDVATALKLLLDQVDYTNGACSITEMVGAVLSTDVIRLCHKALKVDAEKPVSAKSR